MASTVLPNGIIIPEKFSRDWYADLYHNWQELDNLLGGGTPKDGTLTIQKNGSTVGTFSANQATNETVNIEVPTKTSDLTNDSGFITSDNTKIPLAGSNQISGDLIPATTDAYDLGGPSYQWNNAYIKSLTINGVACGDILTHDAAEFASKATTLSGYGITDAYTKTQVDKKVSDLVNSAPETLDTLNELASALGNDPNFATTVANQIGTKANDSEVVKLSGNQTIAGIKSFSNDIRISKASPFCNVFSSGYIKGQAPTSNIYSGVRFFDDINSGSTNTITGGFEVEYNRDGYNKSYIASRNYAGENHKFFTVGLRVPNDDTRSVDFLPSVNGIVNLGTSTNKWKSLNGINPGALSLPGNYINIDTTNWVLDGTPNHFVPTSDGWLGIQAIDTVYDQMHYVFIGRTGGGSTYYQQNLALPVNALWDSKYHGCIFIPVVKNFNYDIKCICSTITATFYPCQGNV